MIAPETLAARHAAFIEDVEFLIEQGADMNETCRRLSRSRHTLVNKLQELGRADLITRLDPAYKPRRDRVPAAPVVEHLKRLQRDGWSLAHIAMAAGIETWTIDQILYRKARTVSRKAADGILAVDGTPVERSQTPSDWSRMQPGWDRQPETREVA